MLQVTLKSGKALLAEVPVPKVGDGNILVRVVNSCISQGTEIEGMRSSRRTILERVKEKPEIIHKTIASVKEEGVFRTIAKVQSAISKKGSVSPTGYSAAGIAVEIGQNIKDIMVGDRVACAGAAHAEYVDVPRNLVMKIPHNLDFQKASTAALGGIAMQAVRRGEFKLGEFVVVVGLGLLGQISVQLLNASGCRVIAVDLDDRRSTIAKKHGAEITFNYSEIDDVVRKVTHYTNGYGADGVIFAAATTSNKPLSGAFKMCRKKGKVVLVGVSAMEIERKDIYQKELDFLISTSYGPGRYDENYEQKGLDYPYAYVRWTENRSMQEYLRLLADARIRIEDLVEKVYPISEATRAYEQLQSLAENPIIALFEYPQEEKKFERKLKITPYVKKEKKIINVAIIGAGDFAKAVHIPNLQKMPNKYAVYAIVSRSGLNATETARKVNANAASTDYDEILKDRNVDLVMICTRHNLHAQYAIKALKARKPVFVEKPMAVNAAELNELIRVIEDARLPFMVGFNRRFSPYCQEIKNHISKRTNPMVISYRMNVGYFPPDHWVHNEEGGGRIIGEACHIIDLFTFFTDSQIESVTAEKIVPKTEAILSADNVSMNLKYKDGSIGNLTYTALGNRKYSKENLEIYFDEKVIRMTDYQKLEGFGLNIRNIKSKTPRKGHIEELETYYETLIGKTAEMPIALWDLVQTTKTTFSI